MVTMQLGNQTYNLASTLRVAYAIQGQHNHKSYLDIFKEIGSMPIEQQIGITYAAYISHPDQRELDKEKLLKESQFRELVLDEYNLKELMEILQELIAGMMGTTVKEMNSPNSQAPVELVQATK
jgi:hypothetical protein